MRLPALALLLATFPAAAAPAAPDPVAAVRERLPEDEVIYFLLPDRFENGDSSNDRGGLGGDRLATGFDPAAKGFYHGGDLKGLIRRLPYVKALGATAIWVGPVFRNKPVQGPPGRESAGYHGYWITDFTSVDPHLGTDADFAALVRRAHALGLKVYMDIIANHTADVIRYRECGAAGQPPCTYRSRADYPYTRRGGAGGPAINPGFAGDALGTAANFARLTDPSYAYTPFVPAAEAHAKTPDWLNDPRFYHNRGDTTFEDESATMGDFSGLDDLMTEDPRVVDGMVAVYGGWIDRYGIDGFRIDTARHVNPEFWARFVPAMLERARALGIPHFHVFGEVSRHSIDSGPLARHTLVDRYPAVLDFAFRQAAVETVAGGEGTRDWARLFDGDVLYAGGEAAARTLPTFVSNHDDGRFAFFVRRAFPAATDAEVLARVSLAHAMLLLLRGVPTIYSGDEQGFAGSGGDQDARQDMFASRVASYNAERLVGTGGSTAVAHFGERHPLFRLIASLARVRTATPALTRGRQVVRAAGDRPGLLAASRFDPVTGREVLLAFNTSAAPVRANVQVEAASELFRPLAAAEGASCAPRAWAPGSTRVVLPPFGWLACAAR